MEKEPPKSVQVIKYWTTCSCGHIAQDHKEDGRCYSCACNHCDSKLVEKK